jgi:hypothetical protein
VLLDVRAGKLKSRPPSPRRHPEAAESLAKPRTPNKGSLHSAATTVNERLRFVSAPSLLCHPARSKIVRSRTILRSRGTPRLPTPARKSQGVLCRNFVQTGRWWECRREQKQTRGPLDLPTPFPTLKMTILKRKHQQTTASPPDELSNACVRPPHAVILSQRSPRQSQGLPTEDLCTLPKQPRTRGAPSFASFAKGGSIELHNRRVSSCFRRAGWPIPTSCS